MIMVVTQKVSDEKVLTYNILSTNSWTVNSVRPYCQEHSNYYY